MTRPPREPSKADAAAGLWIRVAANIGSRKVTWRLVSACLTGFPIPPGAPRSLYRHAAIGFLVELWGNIAEHTTDGRIVDLPDEQLEQWAGWDGEPGAFAKWLRAQHLDTDTGKCREWDDQQGALQQRREADAQRQRAKRERDKQAAQLAELIEAEEAAAAGGTVAPTNGVTASIDTPDAGIDYRGIAIALTVAANRGMMDNPLIGERFNAIDASRGDALEVIAYLHAESVRDWKLAARIIYTLAKIYKPTKLGDYIRSLVFFRERTARLYRQHMEKQAAAAATAPAEVSIDTKGTRPTPRDKAARTGAGALAAAQAVGLED